MKLKKICFDIDNIICKTSSKRNYLQSKPIKKNIEVINKLYDKRKNIYKLANHRINCDNLSKENIAKKIIGTNWLNFMKNHF